MAGRRTAAFASNARSLRSMEEMSANITTTEAAEAAEAAVAARRTAVERVHIERALVIRERQDDHLIVKESCRDVGSSHRCLAGSFSTNELGIRCVRERERERERERDRVHLYVSVPHSINCELAIACCVPVVAT